MTKKTPEQQAQTKYPLASAAANLSQRAIQRIEEFDAEAEIQREAYADCIREKVEPLEELVQELVDAMAQVEIDPSRLTDKVKSAVLALNAAKELGFVPTQP